MGTACRLVINKPNLLDTPAGIKEILGSFDSALCIIDAATNGNIHLLTSAHKTI